MFKGAAFAFLAGVSFAGFSYWVAVLRGVDPWVIRGLATDGDWWMINAMSIGPLTVIGGIIGHNSEQTDG